MKVLVTGNKGYIGTVLCKNLLEEGFDVVGLDTGFYDGCFLFHPGYAVKQIEKDVRDVLEEDLAGINAVIHLAALSNDPVGALNPVLTQDINYRASLRLARLAKKSGVERFIFSSSCSVYGVSGQEMIDENGVVAPATEYAKSKVDAEKDISGLADTGFSPVFLRNATVYGISPMLRVDLVVNNLAAWAYTTGNIKVMSDGSPWRPLIHIQDISKAFIAALKAPKNIVHNQIFNVGQNSGNYRVREIVEVIKSQMPECNIEFTGEHGADTRTYRVEFSKFNSLLKDYFKPEWNIEKGVKEVLGSYRSVDLKEGAFLGEKFTRLKRINALLKQKKLDKSLRWNTSR